MKRFILIAVTLSVSCAAFGQKAEFIEPRNVQGINSPEYKTFRVKDNTYVLYDHFAMMAPIMHDLQLDAYDANLKPIGSNVIDKTLESGDANIYEGIFALQDKMVMFKSEFAKGKGMTLFYYPFSVTGSRQAGVELVSFSSEKAMNSGNFQVNVSDDGTKIVVLCELPFLKDSLEHGIVYVFDNTFKELWHTDLRFPNSSEKAPHNDLFVNNSGVVFDLKRIPVKKSFDYYSMFTFTNNGKTMKESKIDLGPDGHISTYVSGFCTNGDLYLAGYSYTDKKSGVNVDWPTHVFTVKVSAADGSLPLDKVSEMTREASIKSVKLIVQADNTAILLGENQSETSKARPSPAPPGTYDYEYEYGTITTMKFGADGTKLWTYLVDKSRKSTNDGGRYQSFSALIMNGNLVIVFEDYYYKHDGKEHAVVGPLLVWQFCSVIVTVNQDGSKVSETIINDQRMAGEKAEYHLIARTGVKLSESSMFFIGSRGLELVGVKVTL